jgi:hypothetical protein
MLASSTNLYLTWRDNTGTGSLFDVLFIRSTDSGATFSNVTNVSNSAGQSDEPQIAASEDGNVFVVWDDESPGNSDVFLARSKDRGETFDNITNVSNDKINSDDPKIALSYNNTINLVWQAYSPILNRETLNRETFYVRGYNSGDLFDSAVDLSNTFQDSNNIQIITSPSGNNTYAIWDDTTISVVFGTNQISFRTSNY